MSKCTYSYKTGTNHCHGIFCKHLNTWMLVDFYREPHELIAWFVRDLTLCSTFVPAGTTIFLHKWALRVDASRHASLGAPPTRVETRGRPNTHVVAGIVIAIINKILKFTNRNIKLKLRPSYPGDPRVCLFCAMVASEVPVIDAILYSPRRST